MKKGTAVLAFAAIGGALILLAPDPPPATPEEKAAAEAKAAAKAASDKFQSAMHRCKSQTEAQLADPEGFDPVPYGEWRAIETAEDRHVFTFMCAGSARLSGKSVRKMRLQFVRI